ncbi:RNA-directed DNA polymerase, eukaryota [Tanacetum coccineum]
MICDCWNNEWSWDLSRLISGGTLANQLEYLRSLMDNITLNDVDDIWIWSLGKSLFTVKDTHVHIDQISLPDAHYATRWNRFLPKNVNIFIWRVLHDRLPTRWNLSRRGIDLNSLYCLTCDASIETIDHILWFCSFDTSIWHRVFTWLDLKIPNPSNIHNFFSWIDDMWFSSSYKALLEVICGAAWYLDDDTIIGDNLVVKEVLKLIMKDGPRHGLHLNVDKLRWPCQCGFDFGSELVMKRVAKSI